MGWEVYICAPSVWEVKEKWAGSQHGLRGETFLRPDNQPTMTTAKPKSALEMAHERVVIKKKLEIELPTLRATEAKRGQLCRVHVWKCGWDCGWRVPRQGRWCTHRGSCGGRVPVTAFGTMGFAFSYFLCLYIWAWAHTRQFLPCSYHAHWTWAWSRAVAPGLGQSTALFSLYHMPRASSNTVGFERISSLLFLQSQTSETHVAFCTVQPTLTRPRQHSLSHKAWF